MDIFEKACMEAEPDDMPAYLSNENCIEWIRGSQTATVTLCQKRLINKVKKYAEKYPDEFEIISERNGVIVAHIPRKSIKIQHYEPREMPEEFRLAARERLALARKERKDKNHEENKQ